MKSPGAAVLVACCVGCAPRHHAQATGIPTDRPSAPITARVGPDGTPSRATKGLLGVIDTIINVPAGSPFGAAASARGIAYVTLHAGVSALASWDFNSRQAQERAVATGTEPTNLTFDAKGTHAFVACQWSSSLERVDVGAGLVDAEWETPGNDPYQVAVSPDGTTAFVSGNSGFIHIFDTRSGELRGRVQVREAPNGLAVSSDGRRVYVTHLRSTEVGVVDVAAGTYRPLAQMEGEVGQGIVLSPDDRIVFALSQAAARLYAFDAMTGALLGSVPTSPAPFGLARTPDGRELWVTTLGGMLHRYSADASFRSLGRTELGGRLRRIAIDPKGRGAVVADEDGRILVLR